MQQRRRDLRQVLLGLGLDEAITDEFLHDGDLAAAQHRRATRSASPTRCKPTTTSCGRRCDRACCGPSPSTSRIAAPASRLFEIGHVYPPGDRSSELPPEYEGLAVAIAGRDAAAAMAVWREIARAMGFGARVDQSQVPAGLHPTRSATLSVGRDVVGAVGEIHPDVLDAFGVTERVAWLELDLTRLLAIEPKIAQWKPTSRFPSAPTSTSPSSCPTRSPPRRSTRRSARPAAGLLVELALFDVFRGPGIEPGARSLAYRLRLQAPDRTLTDAEVAAVRDKAAAVMSKMGATLRA